MRTTIKLIKRTIGWTLMVAMIAGMILMFIFTALSMDELAMGSLAVAIVSWAMLLGFDIDIM